MKIGVGNPALGAFVVMLGCTFLADTTVASNTRVLRGQLHKNNSNPIRRRHVQVKAEAPLKETTLKEAPVKAPLGDNNREAPVPKEETIKSPTGMKTKSIEADKDVKSKSSLSTHAELKKTPKGATASSLSLGHLLVKNQREIPRTNLQKCLKPKGEKHVKEAVVKEPAPLKQAAPIAKDPEPESTDLVTSEEMKEDRSGGVVRRREEEEVEEAFFEDPAPKLDTVTVDNVDVAEEDPFADFHIICDADGNLLEGETWAPTMAPNDDEDLLGSDGDGITDVEEDVGDTDPDFEYTYGDGDGDGDVVTESEEAYLLSPLKKADNSSTGMSRCIIVNVIAFLFCYRNIG